MNESKKNRIFFIIITTPDRQYCSNIHNRKEGRKADIINFHTTTTADHHTQNTLKKLTTKRSQAKPITITSPYLQDPNKYDKFKIKYDFDVDVDSGSDSNSACIGYSLRNKLGGDDDGPKHITALLLNALVPSIIISSLSGLVAISSETIGSVLGAGILLSITQLIGSELSSRFVIPRPLSSSKYNNYSSDPSQVETETDTETDILRRTASIQLSSMAPGLSVLSFTKEFAGLTLAGLSTLADIPSKIYTLVLLPYYIRYRRGSIKNKSKNYNKNNIKVGDRDDYNEDEVKNINATATATASHKRRQSQSQNKYYKFIQKTIKDPFTLAISSGLFLAAIGRPVSTLGFVGNAITNLAQSQTAILFLLIGLKIKFNGERQKLCLRLLLARYGFMSIFVSLFLYLSTSRSNEAAAIATRLAIVLSSHAASSIIAYGQMNKAVTNDNTKGYDVELAFDIVALSYQMTMILNTIACLAGPAYINNLIYIGFTMLGLSFGLGKI